MKWFGGGPKRDPEEEKRAEASRARILAGGLPLNAVERLMEEAKKQGTPQAFFTSDLSPSELLLTRECGFIPLGQVMGSCVYNVGWQYIPQSAWVYSSTEMVVLSQSQRNARNLAFDRLRQEAQILKADGVVGVRFERVDSDLTSGMVEYKVIGTAVRRLDSPPLAPGHQPFVSNLSGQEHWMLRKEGFAPVGFVFGNCSWYQFPDWKSQVTMGSFRNGEIVAATAGLYTSREFAQTRLEDEMRALNATGVVGVGYNSHIEIMASDQNQQGGFIFHFTIWGTAITREDFSAEAGPIQTVVSLQD